MARKISILVAEDHLIVREGLVVLLNRQADMEVVGEAEDGRTTVRLARELRPDLVIMDVGLPDLNGIDATRQIKAEVPGVKVIALSMHADKRFVAGMLQAGASGYMLKHCASEELVNAIHVVMDKRTYLSPYIAGTVVDDYVKRLSESDSSVFSLLTTREREVLQLFAEGKITRQIAGILNISVKTVEAHRKQITEKLGFQSFADLIKYAIREGLVSLDA